MPEYIQIQTYARGNRETFPEILRRYQAVLRKIGCSDDRVSRWLNELRWPILDEDSFGDIFASPFILFPDSPKALTCAGMDVTLYMVTPVQSIEDLPPWIGFNLLFDTTTLRINSGTVYKPGLGGILWQIMRELVASFHEIGVYLTDEWQENRSWRAIVEDQGEPWSFDLGIFPKELADSFAKVPAGFQGTVVPQGFAFAQVNRWKTLPWVEGDREQR